jgi:tight adherence protein C
VTTALLAGLLAGSGVWLAWSGWRPAPEPLAAALARIADRPIDAPPLAADGIDDRDMRVGRFLLRRIPVLANAVERLRADLRVVGRPPELHAARVGSYVVAALVVGPWLGLVAWLVGAPLPTVVPLVVAIGGAGWGAVVPFVRLRAEARARRAAFAYALSAWCDVVVMNLAAGRGVEQAMETAASAGQGWAFAELRGAMRGGYIRAETPWDALGQLGVDLGVADLSELASTIAMAGEEGAAVRVTVAAKARTIRERITADTELRAAAATERMSLPSVILVVGFLVFLGYPAMTVMFQLSG